MSRNANWKTWVVLSMAVAVIVASGGLVMGSNLGFKINKAIVQNPPTGSTGFNWTSIPFNSPYPRAKDLCTAVFANSSAVTLKRTVPFVTTAGCPVAGTCPAVAGPIATGTVTSFNCALGAGAASNFCMSDMVTGANNSACQGKSRGIQIINTLPAGNPVTTVGRVIVGSSDESTPLPAIIGDSGCTAPAFPSPGCGTGLARVPNTPTGGLPAGDNWISVPYHTTWVNAHDICDFYGLGGFANATDPCPLPATPCGVNGIGIVSALNAATGTFTNHTCGATCAGTFIGDFALVLGESIRIRKTVPTVGACIANYPIDLPSTLPPHF